MIGTVLVNTKEVEQQITAVKRQVTLHSNAKKDKTISHSLFWHFGMADIIIYYPFYHLLSIIIPD